MTAENEIIHVIHSRFMQNQANLTALLPARLHQFVAFCLPAIVGQKSQNFIWVIKIDPALAEPSTTARKLLFEPFLKSIRDYQQSSSNPNNVFVVASNRYYSILGDVWAHAVSNDGGNDNNKYDKTTKKKEERAVHGRQKDTGTCVPAEGIGADIANWIGR